MTFAAVITLGCKTNQCDGESIRRGLHRLGCTLVEDVNGRVDVAVVNTCTVTVRADRKCRQLISKLARTHPSMRIYVTGCYVHRSHSELSELPGVAATSADRGEMLRIIAEREGLVEAGLAHDAELLQRHRCRAFLKVQDGCDAFCSYCIVPRVRPVMHSEPIDRIAAEAEALAAAGYKEIVVTGIHVGRYGVDLDDGVTIADVVRRIADTLGLARVRLSSIEMPEVDDELVEVIATHPVVCEHVHLPLQSGDDGVLETMNRRYTSARFLDAVAEIRSRVPDVAVTTDVIAGFPGESDEAFENTIAVCRKVGFSKIHVFPFSVRPGTTAAEMPNHVRASVITARKKRLLQVADELALDQKRRFIGKTVQVLVEETDISSSGKPISTGLTEHYSRVRFRSDGDLSNRIVPVTISDVTAEVMTGKLDI